jgi:hypothetical protein
MRRLVIVLAAAVVATLATPVADADGPVVVSGGGTGTFAADLDPGIDPDVDGSHFGLGAVFGGSVRGHFECLMAGNTDILGLPLMAVEGKVTGGWADSAAGTAMFTGLATVNLGKGVAFRGVPFEVALSAGGPGVGQLQLTVIGAFDGVPGDTAPGNGNYDLPVETVATGQIRIQ